MSLKNRFKKIFGSYGKSGQILAALLVFAVGLTATIWTTRSDFQQNRLKQTSDKQRVMEEIEKSVQARFFNYEEILRGAAGFIQSSEVVTEQEFHNYFAGFNIKERYPGLIGFGFSPHIRDPARNSVSFNGLNYEIKPAGTRESYAPITYMTPVYPISQKMIGFDLFSDNIHKNTMQHAVNSSNIAITGSVEMGRDENNNEVASIVMYFPLYTKNSPIDTLENKQSSIAGYIYSPIKLADFFTNIHPDVENNAVGIKMIDTTDENSQKVIYEKNGFEGLPIKNNEARKVSEYNRSWEFDYKFADQFWVIRGDNAPFEIFIVGLMGSFLLGIFVYFVLYARSSSMAYAEQQKLQNAKDELLSLASHQLRTPATGVKQYVGMLNQGYAGKLTKDQKEFVEKAYECNERQLDIINQMLYVARADSGRLSLKQQNVNLRTMVDSCICEQKTLVKKRGQTIEFKKPKCRILVKGDEQYLRMTIENLINNASKYTKKRGKITASIKSNSEEVIVSIKDTGVGISKKDINKLFEKFSRIDNELSTEVGGSGIGLYLAKQIALLHGGRIEVESEPNKGSDFKLILPLIERECQK